MPGYEKPRLRQFSSRSGVHAIIILRLFGTLLMSTVLGFSLNLIHLATHPLDSLYFSVYSTGLFTFWGLVLGQLLVPAAIKISDILDIQPKRFHRSHVSHMRMDRLRRSANYRNDRLSCCSLYELAVVPLQLFRRILISPWYWVTSAFVFSTFAAHVTTHSNTTLTHSHLPAHVYLSHTPSFRLRGGFDSDSDNESSDDCGSDRETSGKRKRKASTSAPRKSRKGEGRAVSEADSGIRVTVGKGKAQGLYVDEVVEIQSAPEYWCVLQSDARRAYIVDLTGSPECLESTNAPLTVDGFIKKQCQDSMTGPTGARDEGKLAEVLILNPGEGIPCRRSNLTCGGFYTCSFAEQGHPRGCARWDDDSEDVIAAPIRAAKSAEAKSLVAIAMQFYESVMSKHCNGAVEEDFPCGGHAVLRKFLKGRSNGKAYLIGCSNWTKDDDITHRFTKIPAGVRESILRKLFRGEALSDTEDDVVTGPCTQITHSANLLNNKSCPRTHFRDGQHVRGTLSKNKCPAKILILIPIDGTDLRAVVIPKAGTPHNHPLFPRSKVLFEAASKYKECITATGPIGTTTLRVDKSSSTRNILDGRLPQEIHPSLINNRRRRDMVHKARREKFPAGTGMQAVWTEFEKEKSRPPADRYIHAVNTRSDEIHVIITMNPDLAALTLDASWIMVDTTFVVVHGKTNEWKLLIWLDGLEKRTVVGRVWSNRATREAFRLVWDGVFDAIQALTGHVLNFKNFDKKSSLLGALGDSEGAQAQGLGDVLILRRMVPQHIGGMIMTDVDIILMFIWKTCIVHFNRGVFALESYLDDLTFQYLLSFPYLETDAEIQEYYNFCNVSSIPKLKTWWAHKKSYPWLLPSLNRQLSKINHDHWDLTPRDTNPIEGSHAQDNQVNSTNRSLIEAILLARQLDSDNARIIMASREFGIWENGNNSIRARFTSQAARQQRNRVKQAESAKSDSGAKKLRAKLKASEELARKQDLEIQSLRSHLNVGLAFDAQAHPPSTLRAGGISFYSLRRAFVHMLFSPFVASWFTCCWSLSTVSPFLTH
ncbi:hypothetical protein B0H16DRAFT_1639892 [Mycena metata]|uniref:Uncharacterized protein n=1 Tax=Mycena metata TaxID=1033252 RepID=A0AAD7DY86_9AGAR|nr:hypothetical protein B0H16DRAFT_1639892 [Mycena metata]